MLGVSPILEPRRSSVLVFDVNETLLDLGALAPEFEEVFADREALREWFARLLHGSTVATMVGRYEPFGVIAASALDDMAVHRGREMGDAVRDRIVGGMRRLPPHPEVDEALGMLQGSGFRLAALTNSSREVVLEQLRNSGLSERFDAVLSVDLVRRFKPHPDCYLATASSLGVPIDGIRMVAAHDWDVAGAITVGARGAFVARHGRSIARGCLAPTSRAMISPRWRIASSPPTARHPEAEAPRSATWCLSCFRADGAFGARGVR